jgi:hypothetical protein
LAGHDEREAVIRDAVIERLRERALEMAQAGLPASEIEIRLVHDGLTPPEREFARTLALGAEASARNMRVAEVLDSETLARQRDRSVRDSD